MFANNSWFCKWRVIFVRPITLAQFRSCCAIYIYQHRFRMLPVYAVFRKKDSFCFPVTSLVKLFLTCLISTGIFLNYPLIQRSWMGLLTVDVWICECTAFWNGTKKAVRMATQYAPTPLLPPLAPKALDLPEQMQPSSSFPHWIRSHADCCSCLTSEGSAK